MSRTHIDQFEHKAQTTINFFKEELKKIRSGRANPSLVEDIAIEAYGSAQPLKNLANISVADATLITVQPWDRSLLGDIEKAIQKSNVGINPVVSGDLLRLPLPPMTEERRKEYVKVMKQAAEEARISIRSIRKDVMIDIAHKKKNSEITEDDETRMEKEVQDMVDQANKQIEDLSLKKEQELMTV